MSVNSSISIYVRNFIEIGKTFCERTETETGFIRPVSMEHSIRVIVYHLHVTCCLLQKKMSALQALVILGAFIHGACAIRCWTCASEYGRYCDDPIDPDYARRHGYEGPYFPRKANCLPTQNACWKGKGKATSPSENINIFLSARYRAILRGTRYSYGMSSVCPSVRL